MSPEKLSGPMYFCHECEEEFDGLPARQEVINTGALPIGNFMSWEDLWEQAGWVQFSCENGCTYHSHDKEMDPTKFGFQVFTDPWRCGGCGMIHEGIKNALACCR